MTYRSCRIRIVKLARLLRAGFLALCFLLCFPAGLRASEAGTAPALPFDLPALMEENEDVVGAVYIPALGICDPVVWKEYENTYYMEHDLYGGNSSSGCIMMDGWNRPDLADCITFIHGHNMADGSMFGSLSSLMRDRALALAEPLFYYYYVEKTPQEDAGDEGRGEVKALCFRIYSYFTADIYDRIYGPPEFYIYYHGPYWDGLTEEGRRVLEDYRDNWYDDLVADMGEQAIHEMPDIDFSGRPKLMALSTCYGAVHGNERFVVVGACVEVCVPEEGP